MLELSPRQRTTIAAAVTVVSAVILIAAVAALLYLVGGFFNAFSGVFLPLAVAGVLALVLNPYYDWLCARLRLPKPAALAALFVSLLIPFVALGWFFGSIIFEQVSDLIARVPDLWQRASVETQERWPRIQAFFNEHPWGLRIREAFETRQEELMAELGNVGGKALSVGAGALRGIGSLFTWAVLPVYLAFFLMADPLRSFQGKDLLPFLKEETRNDVLYLAREFVEIVVAFFRGQLVIAFLQGVLFAIGFSIVGLRYGLVLGLMLGFLNIIPYLGSIIGLGVCLPLAFWQSGGGLMTVVWVLVTFTAVQMIEGYVLTPGSWAAKQACIRWRSSSPSSSGALPWVASPAWSWPFR